MGLVVLPPDLKGRDSAIIQAVLDGDYSVSWSKVTTAYQGHVAELSVFSDALVVPEIGIEGVDGKWDRVRVSVSARSQQTIADILGCCLLTTKLADEVWLQRKVTLTPHTRTISTKTVDMVKHSQSVDKELAGRTGLCCTVGKHWVLDKSLSTPKIPDQAVNYGWHFDGPDFQDIDGEPVATLAKNPKTGSYYRLIQGRGWRHSIDHTDYSQTCVLVSRDCRVDGILLDLADVYMDPELAGLVSHQGALPWYRHPNVPEVYTGMSVVV